MDSVVSIHHTPNGTSMPVIDGRMVDHNFNKLSGWASQIPSVEARINAVENRLKEITTDAQVGAMLVSHLRKNYPETMEVIMEYLISEATKRRVIGHE